MKDAGGDERPRVLVVDAERSVTEMYDRWLGEDGPFEVTTVNSGPAAIQVASEGFDAALIDRQLRSTSGAEVVSKLRDSGHGFPIALVTVSDPADEAVADLDYQRYLTKPVMGNDLRGTISEMVSEHASRESGAEDDADPDAEDGEDGNARAASDPGQNEDDAPDPGQNGEDTTEIESNEDTPDPDEGVSDGDTASVVDRVRASLDGEWPDHAIDVPGVERAMPISGEASSVSLDGESQETIVVPGLRASEPSSGDPSGDGSDGSGATDAGDQDATDAGADPPERETAEGESPEGDGTTSGPGDDGGSESGSDYDQPLLGDVSGEMDRLREELDDDEGDDEEDDEE